MILKHLKPPKIIFQLICTENINANDTKELICWILSDITLMQRGIR